jgi:hypothetical protein
MSDDILPPIPGEPDETRRLREALNRSMAKVMQVIDGAIGLRTAPAEAQKARHRAKNHLADFALSAMQAKHITDAADAATTERGR